jgi:hypothetical protein
MDASLVLATRRELAEAVASERFSPLRARLATLGVEDVQLRDLLTRVSHGPSGQDELCRARDRVEAGEPADRVSLFAWYALLRVAMFALDDLPALRVDDGVKEHILEEFSWLAHPKERESSWLVPGTYVYSALCKLVTLRRFPAGQLHWEVDGLPRSSLWRVRPRDFPRLLRAIGRLGGFRPLLVPHLAWRRRQIVLSEREHYRSLRLMAATLELQPTLLGFTAEAWFYSPDTARVSPHLAWAPRLFDRWGGTVVVVGRAGTDSGVYEGSRTRRELAKTGEFQPTLGLVIWPRAAMRKWAEQVEIETVGRSTKSCV